jgi:hypothetical protein
MRDPVTNEEKMMNLLMTNSTFGKFAQKRKEGINMENMENKEPVAPKCFACDAQPLPFTMHELITHRGLVLGIVCCSECGHVYNTLPIGMKEPTIVSLDNFKH